MRIRCSLYQRKGREVEVIVPVVRLAEGREEVVAQTEVQGQLAVDTPVVLRIITFFPSPVSGLDKQIAAYIPEREAVQHVFPHFSLHPPKQNPPQRQDALH